MQSKERFVYFFSFFYPLYFRKKWKFNVKNYYCISGQDRCYDPIGIQSFKIPDSSFTASSQMSVLTPPFAAKLYLKAGNALDGAWCAAKNDPVRALFMRYQF